MKNKENLKELILDTVKPCKCVPGFKTGSVQVELNESEIEDAHAWIVDSLLIEIEG